MLYYLSPMAEYEINYQKEIEILKVVAEPVYLADPGDAIKQDKEFSNRVEEEIDILEEVNKDPQHITSEQFEKACDITTKEISQLTDETNHCDIANDWWGLRMKGSKQVPDLQTYYLDDAAENHIYYDGKGAIIPVTSHPSRYQGQTYRRGKQHVHPNKDHTYHLPVTDRENKINGFVRKFRKNEKDFRDLRKSKL